MIEEITDVFDDDGFTFINKVGITSVNVKNSSEYSKHTLEDGTSITDNQINRQTELQMSCFTTAEDFADVYKVIDDSRKKAKRFTVQTKVDSYEHMYITDINYSETAQILGSIQFDISFVKQQIVKTKRTKLKKQNVRNKKNTSTAKTGVKTGKPVDKGSYLYQFSKWTKGVL